MATTTTNFNFPIPQSTDLVKDGATAIAALGTSVDTQFVDLKGGTTGQILAKASNTDLDYTWTSPNPGDITAVTAGTGITGGGTSGDVTVSFDQANFGGGQYASGKNKIINGDFGIWQRGTSFTTNGVYYADRFYGIWDGTGTKTISQQTFTPATAPVSGYEGQYFLRFNQTVAGTSGTYNVLSQKIEDVRTFAGQTATLSFWAKAGSSISMNATPKLNQGFGSGGSGTVVNSPISGSAPALTTSWQRFSFTYNVPSISGKTIGTGSSLNLEFYMPLNTTFAIDIWGVQVEAGSTATPFQTASGTIAGELQLAQRYYFRSTPSTSYGWLGSGIAASTTSTSIGVPLPVTMRIAPTSAVDFSTLALVDTVTSTAVTSCTIDTNVTSQNFGVVTAGVASGLTQYRPYYLRQNASSGGYIGFSAEL